MNFKYIAYIALFTSFFLNQLDAGCGSCAADRNKTKKAFIENIPSNGKIDGKTVGVAIFDHPKNPRHSTWWHARDYGLVAANPFGVSYFEGKKRGTGDMLMKPGSKVTFRYRFVFHEGDAKTANIASQYKFYKDASKLGD